MCAAAMLQSGGRHCPPWQQPHGAISHAMPGTPAEHSCVMPLICSRRLCLYSQTFEHAHDQAQTQANLTGSPLIVPPSRQQLHGLHVS